MANSANLNVNWDNADNLTQNDIEHFGVENKEVLIDDVDHKIYTIKDYVPNRITKSFFKPSHVVLTTLIIILIIVIAIISHNNNSSSSRYDYLSNTSTSLINSTYLTESAHDIKDETETTRTTLDDTTYYNTIIDTTSEEDNLIFTDEPDTYYSTIIDTTSKEDNLIFTDEPYTYEENGIANEIFLCEENKIWSYELNSQKLTLLYESEHMIKAFEFDSNKTLIVSEKNKIVSLRKQENQTQMNVYLIFEESRVNPKAMAMDFINNNLYIVDESMGGLIIINTVTKYYSLLLMDLKAPRSIAMDPLKGILFIVTSESIISGNMDGTSLLVILPSTRTDSITLDKKAEKIYWIHDFENIKRSDYTGSNLEDVISDHTSISELTILGNRLFWLRIVHGINSALWSCSIDDDNCNDHSLHYTGESLKNPKLIKALARFNNTLKYYIPSTQQKCDHLSLAMPDGQYSCACNMGWQLVYNKRCQQYTEFGLYNLGETIRARFLDTSRTLSVEYFWPTRYKVESLKCKSSIDFDYDLKNDNFYFSDDINIYHMKMKEQSSDQIIFQSFDLNRCLQYLVYDWFSGNIYYISHKNSRDYDYYIGMLATKSHAMKKKLASFNCDRYYRPSYGCSYGLTLSSSLGYLFFTISLDSYRLRFQRYTINEGKVVKVSDINFAYQFWQLFFAVDFTQNRLYYYNYNDPTYSDIHHINFDGTDKKNIPYKLMKQGDVQSISVHKQWIYLTCNKSIWKIHKETGELKNMINIENNRKENYASFKIISQPEDNRNPCRNNNGGCEQICYTGPEAICDCGDDFTLLSNGSSCKSRQ